MTNSDAKGGAPTVELLRTIPVTSAAILRSSCPRSCVGTGARREKNGVNPSPCTRLSIIFPALSVGASRGSGRHWRAVGTHIAFRASYRRVYVISESSRIISTDWIVANIGIQVDSTLFANRVSVYPPSQSGAVSSIESKI